MTSQFLNFTTSPDTMYKTLGGTDPIKLQFHEDQKVQIESILFYFYYC